MLSTLLGNKSKTEYNTVGWPTVSTSPRGVATTGIAGDFETTYAYDIAARTSTVTGPTGDVSKTVLDANGNTVLVASGITSAKPAGDVTVYGYTDADELALVDAPGTGSKSYTYWPAGQRKRYTNELGAYTDYTYDAAGRLDTETDPIGKVTDYSYDAAGRLATVTQPGVGATCAGTKVACVTYAYDDARRPTGVDYSDTATPDVTGISYDALGRRVAATASGVTETWAWDTLSRLTSHADANSRTVGYGWDGTGNNTTIAYPDGVGTVTRTFDNASRLTKTTDWSGRVASFVYDADSNWVTSSFSNDSNTQTTGTDQYTYDAAGRMASVTWRQFGPTGTINGSETYTRPIDTKGMVKDLTPTGSAGSTAKTNAYDDRDRLTTAGTEGFVYDPAGNLTERADGTLQVFDPAQRLCWTSPTATTGTCETAAPNDATLYAYDDRGNRTGEASPDGTARTLSYDQANRLTGVTNTPVAPVSAMDGVAVPGNFDGEGGDDVFWYRPGAGQDYAMWGAPRASFGAAADPFTVSGTYV